ncbi:MAG TPA: Rrf2 family transcriptional regulator [Chitinophagales bacterium]|jgi:Rrf2 family protein|nr:Rrf2 family transcriptional regulator [Chitinophagales bacterium]HQG39037.1 Rrf2 family transcriptional regulator [Chitinophagales bacterium]
MFSKSTEYALRATIFIARQSSIDKKVSIHEIAEGIGAPKPFTAKILQQLTNKEYGIISSVTGPSGGFYITDEARAKPIFSVIDIMGERHVIEKCVLGLPKCSDEHPCSMHKSYKIIKFELIGMFKNKTIDELSKSKDHLIPVNLIHDKI